MRRASNPPCIYCKSSKVIRHGRTTTGNTRYRCRNCGKTWVLEKTEIMRPDMGDIVESYLNGRTCRDLVNVYHSSPLRINQKIREFLSGTPNWEEYLDACIPKHEPKLVYLIGRNFSAAVKGAKNNTMFLAMAIDALSTVVLGYEIGQKDSKSVWITLLDRMMKRGINPSTFMTNGAKSIEDAAQVVYPNSIIRIFYQKAYRDREISCCLSKYPANNKLITDAVKAYESLNNKNLTNYISNINGKSLKEMLSAEPDHFTKRLKERLDSRPKIRIEGLSSAFQTRFEKFHMLKDDPYPLINGWIAKWMLSTLDIGFSRLSIYMQYPVETTFKSYSCGQIPMLMSLSDSSPQLSNFVVEIAARGIQLPIFYNRCEMKLDRCNLF